MNRTLIAYALFFVTACPPPTQPPDPCGAALDGGCVGPTSCAENPCTAPGRTVCTEPDGGVICSCVAGTQDDGHGGCTAVDPCSPNPCTEPHRGQCVSAGGSALCRCEAGFIDDGAGACVQAATCASSPCTQPHRSVCNEAAGAVTCACDVGYQLDVLGQCLLAVTCASSPCTEPHRGLCTEAGGSTTCGCDPGFEERGGACVQIDPCQPSPCLRPNQSACTALADAGVECGCDIGFQPGPGGCVVVPPPTCAGAHDAGDAFEPDECPALATRINVGAAAQAHTFAPAGDVDWVRFDADAGMVVEIAQTGPLASLLSLYDGTVTPLVTDGPDHLIVKLQGGVHFVRVRGRTGLEQGASPLQITQLPDDDYGDTDPSATAVPLGAVSGHFDFPFDWDVLSVPVVAGHVYEFSETSPADVLLRLTRDAGRTVTTADVVETIRFKARVTERVTLGVRLVSTTSLGSWTVTLQDLGPDDQADDRVGANTLMVGAPLSGQFQFPTDWECLAVPVQPGRVYRFAETTPFNVNFSVLSPTAVLVGTTSADSVTLKAADAGPLFACISQEVSGSLGAWTLEVTDLGLDDHGDTRATATALTLGAAATAGELQFIGDVDVFRIDVPSAMTVRVVTTGVMTSMQVVNPSGSVALSANTPGSVSFTAAAAGTWWVQVSPGTLGGYTVRAAP